MTKLNDDSLMPFGKHKGTKMKDVPADYLLWFFEEKSSALSSTLSSQDETVLEYIDDNLEGVEEEAGFYW